MLFFSQKKKKFKKALYSIVDCELLYPQEEKNPKKKISRQSYQPFKFLGQKIDFFRFFRENFFSLELKYINSTKQNILYPNQQKKSFKNVICEKN
jgi:hypothetical protein